MMCKKHPGAYGCFHLSHGSATSDLSYVLKALKWFDGIWGGQGEAKQKA